MRITSSATTGRRSPITRAPSSSSRTIRWSTSAAEELDRAAADYSLVIALAPDRPEGWRNRALIRLFKGDNKAGIADYDKAIRIDPSDAYSWNNRGQAKLRAGDRKGAIADFRKVLELRPDLSQVRQTLRELGVKL